MKKIRSQEQIAAQRRFFARRGLYDPRFEHDACGVGFVCDLKGRRTHTMVQQGLEVLRRLSHRGATGADPQTGDGAGILIQIPHRFFAGAAEAASIRLPAAGHYGTGLIFLPTDERERAFCKAALEEAVALLGQTFLGWRSVPLDNADIGATARKTQPVIEQPFIGRSASLADTLAFERALYCIRKVAENRVRAAALRQQASFYITNLSCRTFSYKGLLMPEQLERFFPDLRDPALESALCLVHSRYSTNTFPTWDLAQPFRFLAHNGEINTLRGNINWMQARQGLLESALFPRPLRELLPVIVPGGSDSAALDNVFELLCLSGRSLEHAMMLLVPAAWEQDQHVSGVQRDFYQYHACLTEPWDGPAAVAFTDGERIGAVLDRNGLRPARYIVTRDDFVVMASEVGVLSIEPSRIVSCGRLEPGRMFFIDTAAGTIVNDQELKERLAGAAPYGVWLKAQLSDFDSLPAAPAAPTPLEADLTQLLAASGYTQEDFKFILAPMAETGQEPIGSMGNDTPPAVFSSRPQVLYAYFKQLFAQVTNPAIDPIREELVMSLETYLGAEGNLLEEMPAQCHKLRVGHPVLSNEELQKLRAFNAPGFRARTVSTLFSPAGDRTAVSGACAQALERICREAEEAIGAGDTVLILSDRGIGSDRAALPALLATAAVHHHLLRRGMRTRASIIVECADAREVHHLALLFGYGAECVNPYLALAAVELLVREETVALESNLARAHYLKALHKGILKILSKMGISTLRSYRGAQIFEALGIHQSLIDRYFPGTVSRIGGLTLELLAEETAQFHRKAFVPPDAGAAVSLESGGLYQWRRDGEFHLWNPQSIAALQDAARMNDPEKYLLFSRLINEQSVQPTTLRSCLRFKKTVPIDPAAVEPVETIVKRFATGAMSFGSISRGAHETLAIAMNRLGGRSNTGEGGEDPSRFRPLPNGDSARSSIKQVASGRFGVTTNYLVNADELQIKIAQGAKPGEGGQLPGHKVSVTIARTRYTTPGVTLISPPPHHDIYSIEDLAQLIFDLKNTNPRARISVKLVSEIGVGTIAAGVAKGHADMILISGGDGGTGASPLSSIRNAGLPWELGLAEAHQTLVLNSLRSRVRLQTDGQMRTGRDVAIAALLGAEEFGFCTAALVVCGCVMLRHCHLNNCSVGVATQEELLEKRFRGRPEYVQNYLRFVAQELRQIMAGLGVRSIDELIGRTDLLELDETILPWKAREVDFSRLLLRPHVTDEKETRCSRSQQHAIGQVLDRRLIELAQPALQESKAVEFSLPISNVDRATGAMLSGEVCRRFGETGLPQETIRCRFRGVAGQSFGAWLAKGIVFELEGMANDYVGKGISGGAIAIRPDRAASFDAARNIIVGNTAFYGAIQGEAYIRGKAGERFCIRNSGLYAVVEGVGDHGCEYMTGGRVVVLGAVGRNFGAGMSGGIAYVYDEAGDFASRCNREMVFLEELQDEDVREIDHLLNAHIRSTGSDRAQSLRRDWAQTRKRFVKVMPIEYQRILQHQKALETAGLENGDG